MTTYLKEERDYVPWYAVDGALSTIEKNLQRKGAFGNFQVRVTPYSWGQQKVSGFWSSVGFKIGAVTRFFIYIFFSAIFFFASR